MSGLSPAGETAVLNALTGGATPISYVSLHTADPGTTGASEVAGGAYARVGPVAFANAGSEPTVASNSAIVAFATATAAWGTPTFFGVWSAATAGTFSGSGAISTPKAINIGDQARFLANSLTMTAQ
jgi:hypothetical protein